MLNQEIEKVLRSAVLQHLSDDELGDYHDNIADEITRSRIKAHLERCLICTKKLEMMAEVLEEFEKSKEDTLVADLATAKIQQTPRIWKEIRAGLRRLSDELKVLVGEGTAEFLELSPTLQPYQFTLAIDSMQFRGSQRKREEVKDVPVRQAQELKLPDTEKERQVILTVRVDSRGGTDLAIEIIEVRTNVPLVEASVVLYAQDEAGERGIMLENEPNREDSKWIFHTLRAGKYVIQVQHLETTWEIFLAFSTTGHA